MVASEIRVSVFNRIENIVGQGENADYQTISSISLNVSKRPLLQGSYKSGFCWKGLNKPVAIHKLLQLWMVLDFHLLSGLNRLSR